ncbi:glia maturation factor beta [Hyla sarda]|uniref:glia maturation factor beta n=1 Tax=Hyla sarda TaxID=327740 RepID=UPI0024C45F9A|nr:glia maturation factor beta [Hyla sarda]
MSESLVVCEVDEQLVEKLKKFRFRKETSNAAIISELSTRKGGSRSLVLPVNRNIAMRKRDSPPPPIYQSGVKSPVGTARGNLIIIIIFFKVFEIRNTEDLTEEWLIEKLGFFH